MKKNEVEKRDVEKISTETTQDADSDNKESIKKTEENKVEAPQKPIDNTKIQAPLSSVLNGEKGMMDLINRIKTTEIKVIHQKIGRNQLLPNKSAQLRIIRLMMSKPLPTAQRRCSKIKENQHGIET